MNRRITLILFTFTLGCLSPVCSFEQGSYFVFELIDSEENESQTGRLTLKKEALTAKESTASSTPSLQIESEEFLVDFSEPEKESEATSFEIETPDFGAGTKQEEVSFGTSSFGTSDSVFGE